MDLITVIVPVYNREKYLKACLDSILNQTYKELEIVVINDGSTDNSELIIKEYTVKYPNIIYIYQKNQGPSIARNNGLRRALGKYITFVDSDDIISENLIEILYKELIFNKADIVFTSLKRFRVLRDVEQGKVNYNKEICDSKNALKRYYKSKLGNVCGGIFNRELFDGIGFPPNLIYEDNFAKSKLLFKADRIVFINADLYFYRITRNSITTQKFISKKLDILIVGQKIDKYLKYHDKNFNYYKNDFYKMMYEMTYQHFNDAIDSKCDMELFERKLSFTFLYKIILIGLKSNFYKYFSSFIEINILLMIYVCRYFFKKVLKL